MHSPIPRSLTGHHSRLRFWLAIAASACLSCAVVSCGDSDEAFQAPPPAAAPRLYHVGPLSGALAQELARQFTLVELSDNASDAGIIMDGGALASLTPDQQATLRATAAAHQPIILLEATEAEVQSLHALLGTNLTFKLHDGITDVEHFAILLPRDNPYYTQWVSHHPRQHNLVDVPIDSASARARRVARLLQWPNQPRGLPAPGSCMQPNDLQCLIHAQIFQTSFSAANNTYQFVLSGWAAHSLDQNLDYFVFVVDVDWEAAGAFTTNQSRNKYWFTSQYCAGFVNIEWYDYCLQNGGECPLTVFADSPPTTVDNVSISTGISWSIGGSVSAGGQGDDPTGGVSVTGGVSFNKTTTTSGTQITTTNLSLQSPTETQWLFQIDPPSWPSDLCEPGAIGQPAPVSIGNFQPEFAWINIAQPAVRTADLQQGLEVCLNDFFPTLEQRYLDTFPCDSHVVTNPLAGEYQAWFMPFPAIITPTETPAVSPTPTQPAVPPTPTAGAVTVLVNQTVTEPPNLVFTPAAGEVVTVTISGNETRSRITFTVSDNVTGVLVAQFTAPTSNISTLMFTPSTADALKLVADVTVERSAMYTVNVTQAR